jgi:hypothetical protein
MDQNVPIARILSGGATMRAMIRNAPLNLIALLAIQKLHGVHFSKRDEGMYA